MSTNLRVALCAPGEIWGGVEQFVATLYPRLTSLGVETMAIALFEGPLTTRLRQKGLRVATIATARSYDVRAISRMAALLREHRITIVHAHGYKATVLGGIAARLAGAKLIVTEHGLAEAASGFDRFKMAFNTALQRAVSKRFSNAVVYVSHDIRGLVRVHRSRAYETVIYNGLEPPDVAPAASLQDFADEGDTFRIGIVGRLAPVKGHVHLLRALCALPADARLYVFGTGPLEAHCRQFCAANQLEGKVRFMGFRANIVKYMTKLHVLAIPSLHEGLPYTLLEAMYLGVPIVASRVGGLAEVLENEVTALLVPAGDSNALQQALIRLQCNRPLREALAANARAAVWNRFLSGHMAQQYLSVYERVLADG